MGAVALDAAVRAPSAETDSRAALALAHAPNEPLVAPNDESDRRSRPRCGRELTTCTPHRTSTPPVKCCPAVVGRFGSTQDARTVARRVRRSLQPCAPLHRPWAPNPRPRSATAQNTRSASNVPTLANRLTPPPPFDSRTANQTTQAAHRRLNQRTHPEQLTAGGQTQEPVAIVSSDTCPASELHDATGKAASGSPRK